MTTATTVLHVYGHGPDEIERALEEIFAREERPRVLRLQGSYSAVLGRVLVPELQAGYRYLLLQPHASSSWAPLLELGNRTEGLDRALSAALDGASVFSIFVYGNAVSGYRMVRGGVEVDRYLSDPEQFASLQTDDAEPEEAEAPTGAEGSARDPAMGDLEALRGRPERFADLLPSSTSPADFARIVLEPGWWEQRAANVPTVAETQTPDEPSEEGAEDDELVDEEDRMRCIGLALELWAPTEYPFAGELEDIANRETGPALVLAFT